MPSNCLIASQNQYMNLRLNLSTRPFAYTYTHTRTSAMIDPFVSLFMPQDEQPAPSPISVEEAIDCRDSNSRFFNLINRDSQLSIIINDNSTLTSCQLAGQQIVLDRAAYNETHETWALGDRPYQKLSSQPWSSHVRGSELILTSLTNSNNPHTSLYFELTLANELNCIAKLKSIHLQHQVFYFNLNLGFRLGTRPMVDGHTIVVRCNGSLNRIQAQPTKLLCHCNKSAPLLPKSFIGDIPYELVSRSRIKRESSTTTASQQHDQHDQNEDNFILCDAIFSLESTCNLDYLQAQLQFQNRAVVFEVRSVRSSINPSNTTNSNHQANCTNSNSNVSSSTHQQLHQHLPNDLKLANVFAPPLLAGLADDSGVATSSSSSVPTRPKLEPVEQSTSSTTNNNNVMQSHPSTILRIRVRVTNFGVCLMPLMMTNYTSTWRFSW